MLDNEIIVLKAESLSVLNKKVEDFSNCFNILDMFYHIGEECEAWISYRSEIKINSIH